MSIFVDVPDFPDVPDLPGVPALERFVGATVGASINGLLINAGLGQLALQLARPVWGVFDPSGAPVAIADSTRSMQMRAESRVADYPIEQGLFESFNKVRLPYSAVVGLTCGGDQPRRSQFLNAIMDAKDSLDLCTIVLPEIVYFNANIIGYDYRREQRNGATLLHVDLHIEEVRVTVQASFSNVQNPASADPTNQGQVQSAAPGASTAALYGPLAGVI
jgi:hypothetical protein